MATRSSSAGETSVSGISASGISASGIRASSLTVSRMTVGAGEYLTAGLSTLGIVIALFL
jgi:hypothetical protein